MDMLSSIAHLPVSDGRGFLSDGSGFGGGVCADGSPDRCSAGSAAVNVRMTTADVRSIFFMRSPTLFLFSDGLLCAATSRRARRFFCRGPCRLPSCARSASFELQRRGFFDDL